MSTSSKFLIRWVIMTIPLLLLESLIDYYLKVEMGSGRDWLIFFTLMWVGGYYFAYKPTYGKEKAAAAPPPKDPPDDEDGEDPMSGTL